jgi:hypothetical protein
MAVVLDFNLTLKALSLPLLLWTELLENIEYIKSFKFRYKPGSVFTNLLTNLCGQYFGSVQVF